MRKMLFSIAFIGSLLITHHSSLFLMSQRLAIFITIALVLILLVALNAASYVRIEKISDLEHEPDRSTYNAGATGTRALYDYLHESGREVIRWTQKPEALLNEQRMQAGTFVIVGATIVPLEDEDADDILKWVERGGRLILADRRPHYRLRPASGHWNITTEATQYPAADVLADNPEQMTEGVEPVRAGQPTLLTRKVDSVMPSRFAARLSIYVQEEEKATAKQNNEHDETVYGEEGVSGDESPLPPPPVPVESKAINASSASPAPVIHISDKSGGLLVDYKYGAGQIIILSDPFIIANNGISRSDNLQLALNVVAGRAGPIAFDEYHQGRAEGRNRLIAYFAGTPALAMLGQFGLIVLVVLWTRGRRFARPLPLPHVDRRSKLEYVASMAELQQRSRAYDLAIENIYARTRRVLARYAGADNLSSRTLIAERVAARSNINREQLEKLMRDCEDAINGAPINARDALALVAGLREVERQLGLRMRSREIRQAKEQGVGERG
jgi:hypothetical protein